MTKVTGKMKKQKEKDSILILFLKAKNLRVLVMVLMPTFSLNQLPQLSYGIALTEHLLL